MDSHRKVKLMSVCRFKATVRWVICLCLLSSAVIAADPPSAKSTFRDRVAPIFERHCVRCHNDDDHKGGLSLTTGEAARKGGDSGAAFVAAKAAESLLVQYVEGDKPEMPKNSAPLSREQVQTLREWIQSGADWPAGPR